MFKIEKLLKLFPDSNIKKMLAYSYVLSQKKNENLSNSVFEKFFILKKQIPNIDIVYDKSEKTSYFSPIENKIYINNLSIETLFHELTHLLSYRYSMFEIPRKYSSFKANFVQDNDMSLIIMFLELLRTKQHQHIEKINRQNMKDLKVTEIIVKNDSEPQRSELNLIGMMEDIIDAIYDGKSFSQGLVDIQDINHNAIKSPKTAGHGCKYYFSESHQFEEILANYLAISLIDPNNEEFIILKQLLGKDFVDFLDQRVSNMLSNELEIQNAKSQNAIPEIISIIPKK